MTVGGDGDDSGGAGMTVGGDGDDRGVARMIRCTADSSIVSGIIHRDEGV